MTDNTIHLKILLLFTRQDFIFLFSGNHQTSDKTMGPFRGKNIPSHLSHKQIKYIFKNITSRIFVGKNREDGRDEEKGGIRMTVASHALSRSIINFKFETFETNPGDGRVKSRPYHNAMAWKILIINLYNLTLTSGVLLFYTDDC